MKIIGRRVGRWLAAIGLCAPGLAMCGENTVACEYQPAQGPLRVLSEGEIARESRYATDTTGTPREISVRATCRMSRLAITTTVGSEPVAIYVLRRNGVPVALRSGESTEDVLMVYTMTKQQAELHAVVACKETTGGLDLVLVASLEGEPVDLYADSAHLYALKRGESVSGAARVLLKEWYLKEWFPR